VLRQAGGGPPVGDVYRQLGISEATSYVWKKRVAHLSSSELRKLRSLDEESAQRKCVVANLTLDKHMLTKALRQNGITPARRRAFVQRFRETFGATVTPACQLAGFSCTSWYERSRSDAQKALQIRMREVALARPRYGPHASPSCSAEKAGREQEARASPVPPRRAAGAHAHSVAETPSATARARAGSDRCRAAVEHGPRHRRVDRWAAISGADRRRSVESPVSVPGGDRRAVVDAYERRVQTTQLPKSITVDHGTEFTSKALEAWEFYRGVALDFTRPGKPTDNGHTESFNGRLRDACLTAHQFLSLQHAQRVAEAWRRDDNEPRPHSELGGLPPCAFIQSH
jgi:putative transposase